MADTTTAPTSWIPLEANPEVMNKYSQRLGVSSAWSFTDVWGLDDDLLAFIPRPVRAVVLLFPITEKYEEFRRAEEAQIREDGQIVSPHVFFVRQTIGNACGTIGLLHALVNNADELELNDGPLKDIIAQTRDLSPDERASVLETSAALARVHEESSQEGQTVAPPRDSDVDLHFICIVQKEGRIYELDGRKPFPIDHGPMTSTSGGTDGDVLMDAVRVIKQFTARDPDNLNFTVIAFAPTQT
ncbi:Ubiquitin carboxyl-terminal hydrolase isozyme L3 [Geranomyces variabilis]|nr:Ubiquitin carboxyl-terminal hydrolase isozyme L3 [Geranomyces variabilis]